MHESMQTVKMPHYFVAIRVKIVDNKIMIKDCTYILIHCAVNEESTFVQSVLST